MTHVASPIGTFRTPLDVVPKSVIGVEADIGQTRHSCVRVQPVGQITSCFPKWPVQPLLQKYFVSGLTQISCISQSSRPTRGAYRDRHERGAGCGGRESVRRAMAVAGRDEPRERSASVQDDRRLSGRQSRVVLTPVAGAKLAEAKSSPTGFDEPLIRQ